jgi:hypothetical protein
MTDEATPPILFAAANLKEVNMAEEPEQLQPKKNGTGNGTGPNPFDPARYRIEPSSAAGPGIKRQITQIPIRKPGAQTFVQVRPGNEYRMVAQVIQLKEEGEIYLVEPEIVPELITECVPMLLLTTMTMQGVLTLWPIRQPVDGEKDNDWWISAREAALQAETVWTRVRSNKHLGGYERDIAIGNLPPPKWPDLSFGEILQIAFRNYNIAAMDHPVVRQLRGQ